MLHEKILTFFCASLIVSLLLVSSTEFFELAQAKKSEGVSNTKVLVGQVCGDKLSSETCSIEEKISSYLEAKALENILLDPASRFSMGGIGTITQQSLPTLMPYSIERQPVSSPTYIPPVIEFERIPATPYGTPIVKGELLPLFPPNDSPGIGTSRAPSIDMSEIKGEYEAMHPLGIAFYKDAIIPVMARLPNGEFISASCPELHSLEEIPIEEGVIIFFPLGQTTIKCSATTPSENSGGLTLDINDNSRNRTVAISTVTVIDSIDPIPLFPEIEGPLYAEDGSGVQIDFSEYIWAVNYLTDVYNEDGIAALPDYAFEDVTIDCNYTRNDYYQIGRHEIECDFRDKGGNTVTDSFAFLVEGPDIPEVVEEEPEIPENDLEESPPSQLIPPQEDEILLQPGFNLETDKISYNTGEMMTISGSGLDRTEEVNIYILTSEGEEFTNLLIYSTNDGIFSTPWIIPSHMSYGTYFMIATTSTLYAEAAFELGTSSFGSSNIVDSTTSEIEQSATTELPPWIKNNAAWWSNNAIDDADFLRGIEYLIQQGIIDVPPIESSSNSQSNQPLPDWIKNNAGWWSQDLIGNDEFINAIKWLVEKGVISVSD